MPHLQKALFYFERYTLESLCLEVSHQYSAPIHSLIPMVFPQHPWSPLPPILPALSWSQGMEREPGTWLQTEVKKRAGSQRGLQRMGETHMMGKTQPTPVCRGHSRAKGCDPETEFGAH